jgi:hypothetical protein
MVDNYIDVCAIFLEKRSVLGYENMPYQGLKIGSFDAVGTKSYHLDKITFKYFVQVINAAL